MRRHQAEIVGGIAGVLVTGGCLLATGGVGSVGCMALGGAAAGAVTNVWRSKVQRTKPFSWGSLARDTAFGAAFGAVGGGMGRVAASSMTSIRNSLAMTAARSPAPAAAARTATATGSGASAAAASARTPTASAAAAASPPAAANTAGLEARANAVHGALDPITQNSRTTAALGTRQGQTVLAGGGRDLSPAQRALAQSDEIVARSPGAHAEVTAVRGAQSAGLTPQGIGVSRPICPACQTFLEESGATITGPTTAWWFGR